jgi:Asp-tRNA(Asn)/Glu-tRNA(Gln) amidotransferase A subunit family amidase
MTPNGVGREKSSVTGASLSIIDPPLTAHDRWDSLSQLEARDAVIRAFLPEPLRHSRVEAACANAQAGPLHGVLIGVKNVIRVNGIDTRAGSALPPDALAGDQAAIVDRVEQAGGTVAGKTVTAEFAVTAPGPTRNPRHLDRTPGGSSSGSAAAVAAGMVPLALGTQTIGSVIRPAAYCGVVGFRPTWGVIPLHGVITNARSLDTVGLFTSDVRSADIAAAVLCKWTPEKVPDRLPVLGIPDDAYLGLADSEARCVFARQIESLQRAGYELRRETLVPDLGTFQRNVRTFQRFELAMTHVEWFSKYQHLYRAATAAAIREGQAVTPAQYEASSRWREKFITRTQSVMADAGIDAWISPAATGAPPQGLKSTGSAAMSAPFSFVGMPAIALTTHGNTLPYGVQLSAARHNDRYLLAIATGLETTLAINPPRVM